MTSRDFVPGQLPKPGIHSFTLPICEVLLNSYVELDIQEPFS